MITRRTFRPGRKTLRNGLESTIFAKLCGMTKRSFFCPHIACRVCHLKASEALWRRLSAARQWSAWSSENESVGAAIFAWHSWIVSKMIKDGAHDFPNPGGFGWFGDFLMTKPQNLSHQKENVAFEQAPMVAPNATCPGWRCKSWRVGHTLYTVSSSLCLWYLSKCNKYKREDIAFDFPRLS